MIHVSDSLIITAILFIVVHVMIWSGVFKGMEVIHDKIHPNHHGHGTPILFTTILFITFHVIVWGGGYHIINKIVKSLKRGKEGKDMKKRKCPRCGRYCYSSTEQDEFWACPFCYYMIAKKYEENAD